MEETVVARDSQAKDPIHDRGGTGSRPDGAQHDLAAMLADPIVQALMAADGVDTQRVAALMQRMARVSSLR